MHMCVSHVIQYRHVLTTVVVIIRYYAGLEEATNKLLKCKSEPLTFKTCLKRQLIDY